MTNIFIVYMKKQVTVFFLDSPCLHQKLALFFLVWIEVSFRGCFSHLRFFSDSLSLFWFSFSCSSFPVSRYFFQFFLSLFLVFLLSLGALIWKYCAGVALASCPTVTNNIVLFGSGPVLHAVDKVIRKEKRRESRHNKGGIIKEQAIKEQ